jgi:peptidyl-prolyl cis-trans isomerase C
MSLKPLVLALTVAGLTLAGQAWSQTPPAAPAAPSVAPAKAPEAPSAPSVAKLDPNTPVARVNGVVLNAIHMNLLREERAMRGQTQQQATDENLRDSLINAEVMAQEAGKLGLDKLPGIVAALDLNRKELLGRALIEHYMSKNPVADERVKAEYEKLKAKSGTTEYHARHILVPDEKLAKDIHAKLKAKKVKFEDMAKKYSKDGSAANGGDLGWMAPSNLVPDFANAMTALKKGEISPAPVKTQFGWHVIKLEESRPIAFPEFDKVAARLANQLAQIDIRKYVGDLRAGAKVEVPAPAPVAAPSAPAAPAAPATPAAPAK